MDTVGAARPGDDDGPTQVPDVIMPVVGWRCWESDDRGYLLSPLMQGSWPARRAFDAECRDAELREGDICGIYGPPPAPHEPPGVDCECGVYALRSFPGGYVRSDLVGCVALWGTVVEGEHGWRAARGYPAVVFAAPSVADDHRAAIARTYGIPVLRLPADPTDLLRFGDPSLTAATDELRVAIERSGTGGARAAAEAFLATIERDAPDMIRRAELERAARRRRQARHRARSRVTGAVNRLLHTDHLLAVSVLVPLGIVLIVGLATGMLRVDLPGR